MTPKKHSVSVKAATIISTKTGECAVVWICVLNRKKLITAINKKVADRFAKAVAEALGVVVAHPKKVKP